MMKRWRRMILIGMAAVVLISATGCGKEKETNVDKKIEVTMWTEVGEDSTDYEKAQDALQDKALEEKFPNIKIKKVVKTYGSNYTTEYDKALMSGTAPDFFTSFSYTDVPNRIKNGTIADVTELVKSWNLNAADKVITTFDEVIYKDDKWYAIPRSAYVVGMIGNKKLLSDVGEDSSEMPATWDEFAAVGSRITDLSVPRLGYEVMGMDWCAWPFTNWIWSAGGEMVRDNGDGTYKIAFNEKEGVDTALFMNEMVWKYKMTQKNVLCSMGEMYNDMANGTAAFIWGDLSSVKLEKLKDSGMTYSDMITFALPVKDKSIPNPTLGGGEVITFNPKSTEDVLKVAFEVASYLYYDEDYLKKQWELAETYGQINIQMPARSDMYETKLKSFSALTPELIESIINMSKNAKPEPCCEHWWDLKSQFVNPMQKILLTENITRDEVKKLLDDCANELYKLYPETFQEK